MTITKKEGFTLVELSTTMVASTIVLLAFTSVLVFTRKESSAATRRVNALRDVLVLDGYIHRQLSKTLSDSLLIYSDSAAEQSGTPSSTGTILRTKDIDGNTYRIAVSNQNLSWQKNGVADNSMDSKALNLSFQRSSSPSGEKLNMAITFLSGEDTLSYEWIIAFRN